MSHKLALSIDETDPNALYNTAQVLVSLAEALAEVHPDKQDEAINLLRQAIELFDSCLTRQELEYSEVAELSLFGPKEFGDSDDVEMQEVPTIPEASDAVKVGTSPSAKSRQDLREEKQQEGFARVTAAVSPDDLLETAQADLTAFTVLVSLYAPVESTAIETLAELITPLLKEKIPYYLYLQDDHQSKFSESSSPTNTRTDTELSTANWKVALSNARYRCRSVDAKTYSRCLDDSFSSLLTLPATTAWQPTVELDIETSASSLSKEKIPFSMALLPYADALVDLADAVGDVASSDQYDENAALRLSALSRALTLLYSSIGNAQTTSKAQAARVHITIGDIQLRLLQIARLRGTPHGLLMLREAWAKEAESNFQTARMLLTGSLVSRELDGSLKIGAPDIKAKETELEAMVKEAVASVLKSDPCSGPETLRATVQKTAPGYGQRDVDQVWQDMVEEGLVTDTANA